MLILFQTTISIVNFFEIFNFMRFHGFSLIHENWILKTENLTKVVNLPKDYFSLVRERKDIFYDTNWLDEEFDSLIYDPVLLKKSLNERYDYLIFDSIKMGAFIEVELKNKTSTKFLTKISRSCQL